MLNRTTCRSQIQKQQAQGNFTLQAGYLSCVAEYVYVESLALALKKFKFEMDIELFDSSSPIL